MSDRCENCGRDAGLYRNSAGDWVCGLCIPTDERRKFMTERERRRG